MKFKGFWKSLWKLNMESLKWMKDYWFAYILLLILVTSVYFIPYCIDLCRVTKELKSPEDDIEDFLE